MAERDPNAPEEPIITASQKIVVFEKYSREIREIKKKLDTLVTTVEVRLSNGIHVFDELKRENLERKSEIKELRGEIANMRIQMTPVKPDWWKIIVGVLGILFTFLGAYWGLSQKFSERPTVEQVKDIVQSKLEVMNNQISNMNRELQDIKQELKALRRP